MPKLLERILRRQAAKKGLKGKEADRYVYGALRNAGWAPKKKKEGK